MQDCEGKLLVAASGRARKNKPPFSPIGKVACGRSGVNDAGAGSRREELRGLSGPFSGFRRASGRCFAACANAGASGILGWWLSPMEGELECAIRPLGTDRLAGDLGGARAGRCRWVRIFVITAGSTIAAMIFRRPPQLGQYSISISKEHLSYCTSCSGVVRAAGGEVCAGCGELFGKSV